MTAEIRPILFDDIVPLWHKAWPDNPTNVKPVNTATFRFVCGINGYDSKIPYGPVYFYGAFVNDVLVGVNSCYKSSMTFWMRTRGLYVEPEYRRHGIGSLLVDHALQYAKDQNTTYLWGYPRCTSWPLWEKKGFIPAGRIDQFEYGPHVWAYAIIK